MCSKPEFERRSREVRRIERFVLVPWLAMFFLGPFWLYGVLLGGLHRVLQSTFGLSYDAAAAVTVIVLLGSWFVPPLPLFYVRARAGLICPHCGPFRTPLRFPFYAVRHNTCPKCKMQVFAAT